MIFLYNHNQKIIDEIGMDDIIDATDEQVLNGQITSKISYQYLKHNSEAEYFGYFYNNEFYMYKIIKKRKEGVSISITGIHILFDDLQGVIIRDKRPKNAVVQEALDVILEGTEWIAYANVAIQNSISLYHVTALDALYKIIEAWGCEFMPKIKIGSSGSIEKKIIVKKSLSGDYGKWFEYGDKLLKVVAEDNSSNIATAFIGQGKGEQTENGGFGRKIKFTGIEWKKPKNPCNKPTGQDYVEIEEATVLYGYPSGKPRISVVSFADEEDPKRLLERTYEYAINNSHPKVELQAEAAYNEAIKLGEICAVIRPDLDIRYKTRVFKIQRNLLSGTQRFNFGDKFIKSQTEHIVDGIKKQEKVQDDIIDFLSSTMEHMTNYYLNEDGYNYELKADNEYGLPAGYYSFDKPIGENPSKAIGISAGKLVISNSKNPDGSWKWSAFGDGDGFVADVIKTGVLQGGNVKFDLTNGILNIGDQLTYSVSSGLVMSSSAKKKLLNEVNNKINDVEANIYSSIETLHNEIKLSVSEDYYLKTDAEELVRSISTQMIQNSEMFEFNFTKLIEDLNNLKDETTNNFIDIRKYIRFIDGKIQIGDSDNAISSEYTSDGLEIKYNDFVIAKFSGEVTLVKTLIAERQIMLGEHWAIRPGNYISGYGNNLDIVWLG